MSDADVALKVMKERDEWKRLALLREGDITALRLDRETIQKRAERAERTRDAYEVERNAYRSDYAKAFDALNDARAERMLALDQRNEAIDERNAARREVEALKERVAELDAANTESEREYELVRYGFNEMDASLAREEARHKVTKKLLDEAKALLIEQDRGSNSWRDECIALRMEVRKLTASRDDWKGCAEARLRERSAVEDELAAVRAREKALEDEIADMKASQAAPLSGVATFQQLQAKNTRLERELTEARQDIAAWKDRWRYLQSYVGAK